MAKELNIKKLAVGMSLKDKAKLLFTDRNKRADSGGLEWILTPDDKEAIYNDARKNHQIRGLGELIDKYNVVVHLWVDARDAFYILNLVKRALDYQAILSSYLPEEVLSEHLQAAKTGLKDIATRGTPNQHDASSETSPLELLLILIGKTILFRKIIYKIDYIEKLADFNFLPEKIRNELKEYEEGLESLSKDDEFFEKHTKLSEKYVAEAETEANWMIERFSKINFDKTA